MFRDSLIFIAEKISVIVHVRPTKTWHVEITDDDHGIMWIFPSNELQRFGQRINHRPEQITCAICRQVDIEYDVEYAAHFDACRLYFQCASFEFDVLAILKTGNNSTSLFAMVVEVTTVQSVYIVDCVACDFPVDDVLA